MRVLPALLVALVRLLVGAHGRWVGAVPHAGQRIYFANHASHVDTLALWAALPADLRRRTRPVAARDYWGVGGLRGLVARHGFNAVLVDRERRDPDADPLAPLVAALENHDSLILFPEGTRGKERLPGPFKSGLWRLAARFPEVELVPVYLENLNRAMPKGTFFPIPLTCTVRFGAPLARLPDEPKEAFLARARDAVVALA